MEPLMCRRQLLAKSCAAAAAWWTGLAELLARENESKPSGRHAKSVIRLWLTGGPSQLETFDPHPGTRIAAGTRAIRTSAAGIQLAEGFERLADRMHQVSLVRSLVSQEPDHERGTYLAQSGYRPEPSLEHPSLGAVVCHALPAGGVEIPRHISILPGAWPARGGMLGPEFDAFQLGDPLAPVPDTKDPVAKDRRRRRLTDLEVIEQRLHAGLFPSAVRAEVTNRRQALQMMTSEQLQAFEIAREPQSVLRLYGDSPFGRGCLAARRLIEVGVRCVEVTIDGWDTHVNNHQIHRGLAATLDQAFAALLEDLAERDLLSRTIILCGGEFGRTPTLNALAGRDHWTNGFSYAVAGGSVRGGQTVGETDPEGIRPLVDPVRFADLHATVLATLEIDPAETFLSAAGRPVRRSDGRVLARLIEAC